MISAVTNCMDREAFLACSLRSWLECEAIDEVVVVDWSSAIPLTEHPAIAKMQAEFSKLRVIRVDGQPHYSIAGANHGVDQSRGEIIVKFDSDIILTDPAGLIDVCSRVRPRRFFRCRGKGAWGSCAFHRRAFDRIGGFCESFQSYGGEDVDFYERMKRSGCSFGRIPKRVFSHIPHDDGIRISNQKNRESKARNRDESRALVLANRAAGIVRVERVFNLD